MAVNLIKLCVGISSIEELEELQKNRRNNKIARGLEGINVHVTRNTPKRANEIIGKGSLYWVIKRRVVARQPIIDIGTRTMDGKKSCAIILDSKIIKTETKPCRPFQGWRYLDVADSPRDLSSAETRPVEMPYDLQEELRSLGLL